MNKITVALLALTLNYICLFPSNTLASDDISMEAISLYRDKNFTIKTYQTSGDVIIECIKEFLKITVTDQTPHLVLKGNTCVNIEPAISHTKQLIIEENTAILFPNYFQDKTSILVNGTGHTHSFLVNPNNTTKGQEAPLKRESSVKIVLNQNNDYPLELSFDNENESPTNKDTKQILKEGGAVLANEEIEEMLTIIRQECEQKVVKPQEQTRQPVINSSLKHTISSSSATAASSSTSESSQSGCYL